MLKVFPRRFLEVLFAVLFPHLRLHSSQALTTVLELFPEFLYLIKLLPDFLAQLFNLALGFSLSFKSFAGHEFGFGYLVIGRFQALVERVDFGSAGFQLSLHGGHRQFEVPFGLLFLNEKLGGLLKLDLQFAILVSGMGEIFSDKAQLIEFLFSLLLGRLKLLEIGGCFLLVKQLALARFDKLFFPG